MGDVVIDSWAGSVNSLSTSNIDHVGTCDFIIIILIIRRLKD